ncbi:hypothetical protein ADIAG_03205 [Paeniglutamicibacter gangotriensis Lz1y]|uniref:Uncharacterized protein n=1 Tax=Paeniglutamicibacter gangotriensis Lz1y TaxID=1276920 RepID=M7MR53_9MICC|nr:hypothetical protein ADIAG_03205 [Paeniglutamicibacter gangotriensis Lz1y]
MRWAGNASTVAERGESRTGEARWLSRSGGGPVSHVEFRCSPSSTRKVPEAERLTINCVVTRTTSWHTPRSSSSSVMPVAAT